MGFLVPKRFKHSEGKYKSGMLNGEWQSWHANETYKNQGAMLWI